MTTIIEKAARESADEAIAAQGIERPADLTGIPDGYWPAEREHLSTALGRPPTREECHEYEAEWLVHIQRDRGDLHDSDSQDVRLVAD